MYCKKKEKYLVLKRSNKMLNYKLYWSPISASIETDASIENLIKNELKEEANIKEENIISSTNLGVHEFMTKKKRA